VTIEEAKGPLYGAMACRILKASDDFKNRNSSKGKSLQFWNGKAPQRIVSILLHDSYGSFEGEDKIDERKRFEI
jgi:hypothetical protein